ncbi:MAG: hypothetical protein ACLP07_13345 [Terracidiphilus sp.]
MKAENGPWTERVKGQVYMKLLIAGGNMAANNVLQIRIMPPPTANASNYSGSARLMLASYGEPQTAPASEGSDTSLTGLMEGMLGYSQGRGAQALGQVPVVSQSEPQPVAPPAVAQQPPAPPEPAQEQPGSPAPPAQAQPASPATAAPAGTQQTTSCTQAMNGANALEIAFTSYTTEVQGQQLLADYQTLYNAGLDPSNNCQAMTDSFADRMNQVAAKGVAVSFIVFDGDETTPTNFAGFGPISGAAYANAKTHDSDIIVPNPNEIVMAIKESDVAYEVVLSQQALMNAIYYSQSKTDSSGNPLPLPVPIQMPMAYELGTNVFNMSIRPAEMCEQMMESDTNRFILAAFPNFVPNSNQESGAVSYGNLPGQKQYSSHGYYDLQLPVLGTPSPKPLSTPQNAYFSATGNQEKPVPIYIGYGVKPAACTPVP